MFKRSTSGSVVCPSCGRLVGVNDEKCLGCGRARPGLWGFAPLINQMGRQLSFGDVVLWGCGLLYVVGLLYDPSSIMRGGLLGILSPSSEANWLLGASGTLPVLGFGRWWTVLSAGWLHGGVLHIVFNMMWIRQLIPAVESRFGSGRLVIIYTLSSVAGFALTTLMGLLPLPGPLQGARFLTVGASAAICGLAGALWAYGRRTGDQNIVREIQKIVVYLLVFGLLISGIDNWAHIGGLAGGFMVATWLDPAKEAEEPRHLIIALVCIGLTVASILMSVLHGLAKVDVWRNLVGG